jgi:hypothetical protein
MRRAAVLHSEENSISFEDLASTPDAFAEPLWMAERSGATPMRFMRDSLLGLAGDPPSRFCLEGPLLRNGLSLFALARKLTSAHNFASVSGVKSSMPNVDPS